MSRRALFCPRGSGLATPGLDHNKRFNFNTTDFQLVSRIAQDLVMKQGLHGEVWRGVLITFMPLTCYLL